MGGSSGSTAGGIRLGRVAWLAKATSAHLQPVTRPGQSPSYAFDGEPVEPDQARRKIVLAAVLVGLWPVLLAAGTLVTLLAVTPSELNTARFETASALSSVGLTGGITGPQLPAPVEVTPLLLMWPGRLEVVAVLVLLGGPLATLSRRVAKGRR